MIFALFLIGLNQGFEVIFSQNYSQNYMHFCRQKNTCNKFITRAKMLVKMAAKTGAKIDVKLSIVLKMEYNINKNMCSVRRYVMDFIKPKNANKERIGWLISRRTKLIVEYYSKYTDYDENEVADMFLQNILKDKDFIQWLESRRSKKKIDEIIFGKDGAEITSADDIDDNEDMEES
jgi:hypothetical protein